MYETTTTRPTEPIRIAGSELTEAKCTTCHSTVWVWSSPDAWSAAEAGRIYFDREPFAGDELLSLHPCIHEWAAEDFDDPDWGQVDP